MAPTTPILVGSTDESDLDWIRAAVEQHLGGEPIVTISGVYWLAELPGLKATIAGEPKGILQYRVEKQVCEIITLASLDPAVGVGSVLIDAIRNLCRRNGCTRLWLTTTNGNERTMQFYRKHGFGVVAIHRGAMTKVRTQKPHVPLVDGNGVAIDDFLELEIQLT